MAMNITIIRPSAGVAYLLSTVMAGDTKSPAGAAGYYTQEGNNPGMWLGTGLAGLGMRPGATASKSEAQLLFNHSRHPHTLLPLGAAPLPQAQTVDLRTKEPVSGFDLTFRIPKSISVLWAIADRETQQRIEQAHDQAIISTLDWMEDKVVSTRSGKGGIASHQTRGLIAQAYRHHESRDGDPHLHTHLAVANRVQRAYDGKWLTLDSKTLFRNAVAASEYHENALLDILHAQLGLSFVERPRASTSKAVVADIAGFPTKLVDTFSSRDQAITAKIKELTASWQQQHLDQESIPRTVLDKIKETAWRATRKPKEHTISSLQALSSRWRRQTTSLGFDSPSIVADCVGHPTASIDGRYVAGQKPLLDALARTLLAARANSTSPVGDITPRDIPTEQVEDFTAHSDDIDSLIQDVGREHIAANLHTARTTWTRAHARAEAERLTRLVRCSPGSRESLIDALTDAAMSACIPVTPTLYKLPENVLADNRLAFSGASIFDSPTTALYTSQALLDAEAFLTSLTTRTHVHSLSQVEASQALDAFDAAAKFPLALDQRDAATHLLATDQALVGVVGPAGTGKTTTMNAVAAIWQHHHTAGSVLGIAPSASAATVLGQSIGIPALTASRLIFENTPERATQRRDEIDRLRQALTTAGPYARARQTRKLTALLATHAQYTISADSLIVIDEASMISTHDLARLADLAHLAGAKIALVGDPAQLDAVGAGGTLGAMMRAGKTVHLNSLWRFSQAWERDASLRLRDGDVSVFFRTPKKNNQAVVAKTYADHDRVDSGDGEAMLEAAFQALRESQREGRSALLVAATNQDVFDLNMRTTLERRSEGEVDSSRTVPLPLGPSGVASNAGIGDVIVARKNAPLLRDSQDRPLSNGDLFTLTDISADGAQVTLTRTGDIGQGATITLPASYLARHAELGYATTAHRAQGATVDEAYLYLPYGTGLTRELLYVAMTRGRHSNQVYVALPDDETLNAQGIARHIISPTGQLIDNRPTALSVLAAVCHRQEAQLTATEQQAQDLAHSQHLATLSAHHDFLAALAVKDHVADWLTRWHGPQTTERIVKSETFDPLVAIFRRAHAIDPERAWKLLKLPLAPEPDFEQLTLPGLPEHLRDLDHDRLVDQLTQAVDRAQAQLSKTTATGYQAAVVEQATQALDQARRGGTAAEVDQAKTHLKAVQTKAWLDDQTRQAADALTQAQDVLAQVNPNLAARAYRRLADAIDGPAATHIDDPAWIGGLVVAVPEHLTAHDPALAEHLRQTEHHIQDRITAIASELSSDQPPAWSAQLPERPEAHTDAHSAALWQRAALAVAIYRDYYQITGLDPLGPKVDKKIDKTQYRRRQQVAGLLANWDDPNYPPPPRLTDSSDPHAETSWDQAPEYVDARPDADWIPLDEPEWTPPAEEPADPTQPTPNPAPAAARVGAAPGARTRRAGQGFARPNTQANWRNMLLLPYRRISGWEKEWRQAQAQHAAGEIDDDELDYAHQEYVHMEQERAQMLAWERSLEGKASQANLQPEDLARLVDINQAAWDYWQGLAATHKTWVPNYLKDRGLEEVVDAAYAPPGWTTTLGHLNTLGYSTDDCIQAGVAKISSRGTPIDMFVDRLPVPVHDEQGNIIAFTARRNPKAVGMEDGGKAGPKYVNSPGTPLYRKGASLDGINPDALHKLRQGAIPVLAEGTFDRAAIAAIAHQVHENSGRDIVPLSADGTAITYEQLAIIRAAQGGTITDLLVAFDQDSAGKKGAARLWPMLEPGEQASARTAFWFGAKDPGELLETGRSQDLADGLQSTLPLTLDYITEVTRQASTLPARQQHKLANQLHHTINQAGHSRDDLHLLANTLTDIMPGHDHHTALQPHTPTHAMANTWIEAMPPAADLSASTWEAFTAPSNDTTGPSVGH